ncbi:MAG: hypothetical protein LBN32_02565 [Helicobacteraceae bacterium]|jgi:hypothetical protein|nr:hypothetical protein [Helicobacteraceae bacterium]
MNRRAIALLITLVFILGMLAFAAIFFARTSRALERENTRAAMVGANAFLYGLSNEMLSSLALSAKNNAQNACLLAKDKNKCIDDFLKAAFDLLYTMPLAITIGGAEATALCSSAQTKIDINALKLPLGDARDTPTHRRRLAVERYLSERYRLYSLWQLYELIDFVFDTSGTQYAYLQNDKRLNVSNDRFERGRIGSLRAFEQIVEDYAMITHDRAALEVPWEEIFAFKSLRSQLDFRHLDEASCRIIFADNSFACDRLNEENSRQIDINSLPNFSAQDIQRIQDSSAEAISDFGVSFNHNPIMDCNARYINGKHVAQFAFAYDFERRALFDFRIINY